MYKLQTNKSELFSRTVQVYTLHFSLTTHGYDITTQLRAATASFIKSNNFQIQLLEAKNIHPTLHRYFKLMYLAHLVIL